MTIPLTFDEELDYGNRHKISVPIRVENLPYQIQAIIDTGAGVSCFDRAILPDLGIGDVTTGTAIPIRAANDDGSGPAATGYLHPLQIEIFGRSMNIPVAFSLDWPEGTANLLGMRGFFEQMLIGFEHQQRRMYYSFR